MPRKPSKKGTAKSRVEDRASDQARFLTAFAIIGTISGAALAAKVGKRTHYNWLETDETYAARYEATHEEAIDKAEQELRRRGVEGYNKPVFQGGKMVGTIREFSDTCLIFYLKGRRKSVFGDKREVTGKDGGPIEANVTKVERVIVDAANPKN
jgi:hypothetical protein